MQDPRAQLAWRAARQRGRTAFNAWLAELETTEPEIAHRLPALLRASPSDERNRLLDQIVPGLAQVIEAIEKPEETRPSWTMTIQWLVCGSSSFEGQISPLEALRRGKVEDVLAVAQALWKD